MRGAKPSLSALSALAAPAVLSLLAPQALAAGPAPIAAETLRLPDGSALSSAGAVQARPWQDVAVRLSAMGALAGQPYGLYVVGNESRIVRQELIKTPDGRAWFALTRTPPSAEPFGPTTYSYWVVVARPSRSPGIDIDYCVKATVTGNRQKAKAEVLDLLAGWKVPARAGGGGLVVTGSRAGTVNPSGLTPAQQGARMAAATDPGLPRMVGHVDGATVTAKAMAEMEMFLSGFTGRGMGSRVLRQRAFDALVQQFVPEQVAKAQGFYPPLRAVRREAVAKGLPTTRRELLALQATQGVNAMRVHYTKAHGGEESAWEQYVRSLIRSARIKLLAKF